MWLLVSTNNYICSPGSHKMKASDHSTCICVVPATAVEILLTLAQYISSTPCYVSKLQLLFFWLEITERATDRGACMCSRASCLGLGKPEDRGMERSKRKSPLQIGSHLTRRNGHGETSFHRRLPFRPLHSSISGVGATATPLRAIRIAQAGRSRTRTFSAFRRSLSTVRPNEARLMLVTMPALMTQNS